jgi:uncharacterized membrane protein YidH (DUF202 family)
MNMTGIGLSLFVITIGAILKVGVADRSSDFNLDAIGLILIIVGLVSLVLSVFYEIFYTRGRRSVREAPVEQEVVREPRREVVRERDRL